MTRRLLTSVSALALLLATPIAMVAANAASTDIKIAQGKDAGASDAARGVAKGKLKNLCEDGTKPPCADVATEASDSGAITTETTTGPETGTTEVVPTPVDPGTADAPAQAEAAPSTGSTEAPPVEAQTDEASPAADAEQPAPVVEVQPEQAPVKEKDNPDDVVQTAPEVTAPEVTVPAVTAPEVTAPEAGGTSTSAEQPSTESSAPADSETAPAAVEAEPAADPATTAQTPAASDEAKPESTAAETPADTAKPAEDATPADPAAGTATSAGEPVEAKPAEAQAETAVTTEQPATTDANAEEPAAAAASDQAEPVETTTETVTEETTRTSSEEVSEATQSSGKSDDSNDLIKILGAAAGGVVAGALLNEALNDGGTVVENTGDRVIIERDGAYYVRKDENEILRRPGSDVRTETFRDGSSRTTVDRPGGVSVVTIRDADGYVVQRVRILPDGQRIVLFDDTGDVRDSRNSIDTRRSAWVEEDQLPRFDPTVLPQKRYVDYRNADRSGLRDVLMASPVATIDRSYTLRQVRENLRLRDAMPRLDLDAISFDLGSAAIAPDQVRQLDSLGWAMEDILKQDPDEVFLIEGHTDAVGSRTSNLVLSDRRAETVALALIENYDIPPENLITQGYGEEFLKIETQAAERANRRATVRRITPLLESTAQLR